MTAKETMDLVEKLCKLSTATNKARFNNSGPNETATSSWRELYHVVQTAWAQVRVDDKLQCLRDDVFHYHSVVTSSIQVMAEKHGYNIGDETRSEGIVTQEDIDRSIQDQVVLPKCHFPDHFFAETQFSEPE